MVITMKYPLAIIAAFATAGIGLYIAAYTAHILKRPGFTVAMTAALLFFVASFASLIVMVGNPSRLFNVLSNPVSGFSMMTIGLVLMIVLSAVALGTAKNINAAFYVMAAIGAIVAVCLFYGIALMFVKPSRTALNSWHIPVFMLACTIAMSGMAGSRAVRLTGLALKAVAISGFFIHLAGLEIPDKYLNMELITGSAASLTFVWVITIGIVVPIILEFAGKKRRGFTLAEALTVLAGNTAFFVLINITATRAGNMI